MRQVQPLAILVGVPMRSPNEREMRRAVEAREYARLKSVQEPTRLRGSDYLQLVAVALTGAAPVSCRVASQLCNSYHPGFVETIGVCRARLRDRRYRIVRELGCGYEELPVLRRFPSGLWIRLGPSAQQPPFVPCVLISARREGIA